MPDLVSLISVASKGSFTLDKKPLRPPVAQIRHGVHIAVVYPLRASAHSGYKLLKTLVLRVTVQL